MDKIYLSVIIPAYNEEKRIGNTLLAVDKYLSTQNFLYEILVINDGSTDKTVQTVRGYEKLVKNLKLIDSEPNHGKGYVVRLGMLEALGQYRLFMDADNATTIEHFERMLPLINKHYQVIIGSRDQKDVAGAQQAVKQPAFKRFLGNVGNLLIQIVAVPGIWDTQCGFKLLTDRAAEAIFKRCKIDRWGFDIEMLALARRLKLKMGVVPVYWKNDPDSKVKLSGYLKTFSELFKIKWNLIINKYELK